MKTDKNYSSIFKQELPQYTAPDHLEAEIFELLDNKIISHELKGLKDYMAPIEIWPRIESQLSTSKITPFNIVFKWAAGLALLLSLSYWALIYSGVFDGKEVHVLSIEVNTINDIEYLYMMEFCEVYELDCSNNSLHDLQLEWDETVKALEEVKEAIGHYGNDEFLIRTLSELEWLYHDRINELLKHNWL